MLAHCEGKQDRDQKAAGGLTTPTKCSQAPGVCGDIHVPELIGHQGVLSSIKL